MAASLNWDEAAIADDWQRLQNALRAGDAPDPASFPALAAYHPLLRAIAADQPFIIGQLGQSLDGRIATACGKSHYINGPAALDHLHRLRALADAVVVGAGTVAADNPQLNVRRVEGSCPVRVIIDPSARTLSQSRRWLEGEGKKIVICRQGKEQNCAQAACKVIALPPGADGMLVIDDMIAALAALGLKRLLIEGGAATLSHWLRAGKLERLHLLVGPMIIGAGPVGLNLEPPITSLEQALKPENLDSYRLPQGDLLLDAAFS
jgi:diaminohydroxyphosphoribosylaminopyrimidine deaminase / 5-amino-6-(5-phosphoribosylamino)uracil reductase